MLKTFIEFAQTFLNPVSEQTEDKQGTYCGARFGKKSQEALAKYCEDNGIPNAVPMNKLHVTILYSRKFLPDFVPAGYYAVPHSAEPVSLEVWPSQSGAKCLVLKLDCPSLTKRHKALMKQHKATFDYPEYKTHVTLSYDIGDMSIDKLQAPTAMLYLEREYKEVLDLNWATNNT